MTIMITGGTSFIGSAVMKQLLADNHQIYAVIRPDSPNKGKLPFAANLHILEKDMGSIETIENIEADVFLHMAWDGIGSQGRSDEGIQIQNIENSLKAVLAAKKLGCGRFIFSGSQAEYGICHDIMSETTACNPVSEYGKAKLKFGNQAKILCKSLNMEYIHTRIFSVYGPGDHEWSLVNTCLRTFMEDRQMELGECTQYWNFLYIDDMARALVRLITCKSTEIAGIYNIAGSETRVLRKFVEEMYEVGDRQGSYVYGNRKSNAEGPAHLRPDIRKIKDVTGWHPLIDFAEGIEKTRRSLT